MNMNMPNPFDFPTVREQERETREPGYGPRPSNKAASPSIYEAVIQPYGMGMKIKRNHPKPEEVIEVEEAPVEKKSPVEEYLSGEFRLIEQTVANHLKNNSDSAKLEAALAEVEFYKQLIADAKVAWTKAVPHEEFAWDGLIDVGTILSRTPHQE